MLRPLSRRQLFATAGLALLWPRSLRAAHPRMTLAELVAHSDCCAVGRPVHADARWMVLGGARRIVTLHRVQLDLVLDGEAEAGQTLTVRTLGGSVDGLTQRVSGEAELAPHEPALLFLLRVDAAVHVVTGMARGCFPLRRDAHGIMRLREAASMPAFAQSGAAEALGGATLDEARRLLAQAVRDAGAR